MTKESKIIVLEQDEAPSTTEMKPIDISMSLPRHSAKINKTRDLSKVKMLVVHCTDCEWTIEKLAKYDIGPNHISSTGLPTITYHDVIMKDGSLYHTLSYEEISSHAAGYNTLGVGIALMYTVTNPKTNKDEFAPTVNAIKTLQCHLGNLCFEFSITPHCIYGHRELKGTGWDFDENGNKKQIKSCPGYQLDLDLLRTNVSKYMQVILSASKYYDGAIDGDFGPKSTKAFKLYLANK